MRDDELRSILGQADRPRAFAADEEAAILARLVDSDSTAGPQVAGEAHVLTFEPAEEAETNTRGGLWLAIAACILFSAVGVGVLTRSNAVENDAADERVETTERCTVVGAEIVTVHKQWGSIRDWAIAIRPEPDLAEATAQALRGVLADPDASETLGNLDELVAAVRTSLPADVAEREALLDEALLELGLAVDELPGSCAAPGLNELTN